MPSFRPIRTTEDLPPVGSAVERATLDLKAAVDPRNRFELAKDVAAFANHLGGTLLVGAAERAGMLAGFPGIDTATELVMVRAYEEAIRDRCSPRPQCDLHRLVAEGGAAVLAVNVEPYITQLVGVDFNTRQEGPPAWTFPVRTVTQAIWLSSEVLPMYMTATVRRAIVMLNAIPADSRTIAVFTEHGRACEKARLARIDEAGNAVVFATMNQNALGDIEHFFPLDCVHTVYRNGPGWMVRIKMT